MKFVCIEFAPYSALTPHSDRACSEMEEERGTMIFFALFYRLFHKTKQILRNICLTEPKFTGTFGILQHPRQQFQTAQNCGFQNCYLFREKNRCLFGDGIKSIR